MIVTCDPVMKELVARAESVAPTDMAVFLTGQTGTGKDLFAEYIHHRSDCSGEFITINAAAIPDSMIEAELFGYARGAFTGARDDKPGLFEMADSGTFYLNEIADSTLAFQAKLLEILETKTARRLGENKKRQVNFRLIAATNRDVRHLIKSSRFRVDLYYRLNEFPLQLPPLGSRNGDIPVLVRHFLVKAGFSPNDNGDPRYLEQICTLLSQRYWRGNVRELRTEVRRLWHAGGNDIERMLNLLVEDRNLPEREKLLYTLQESNGNQREAARRLGISETTVRNRIKKYKLIDLI